MSQKESRSRRRARSQVEAANRGHALRSYAKEITREFASKSDRKLARNK
jgi:hypothetical protein